MVCGECGKVVGAGTKERMADLERVESRRGVVPRGPDRKGFLLPERFAPSTQLAVAGQVLPLLFILVLQNGRFLPFSFPLLLISNPILVLFFIPKFQSDHSTDEQVRHH